MTKPKGEGEATEGASGGEGESPHRPNSAARRGLLLAALRQGDLPHGWVASRARAWGLTKEQVSDELARARAEFEASRTPEAAQRLAHELTQQAHELLPEIERIAREPIVTDDPRLLVARLREREARAKGLRELAALKLKTAASYVAIYRKPPEGPPGGGAPPPPLTKEALGADGR